MIVVSSPSKSATIGPDKPAMAPVVRSVVAMQSVVVKLFIVVSLLCCCKQLCVVCKTNVYNPETTQKQEASNALRLDSGLLIRRLQVRVLLGVLMGGGIAEAEGQPPTVLTTQGNPG